MKIIKIFLVVLTFSIFGCSKEDTQSFEFYESNFIDSVSAVVGYDSVNILITQAGYKLKDTIPYEILNDSNLGDTIKLKMDVNFGSPSQNPSPYKSLAIIEDTLHLIYSPYQLANFKLSKSSNVTGVETSPKPVYYSIQKVYISKSPNKEITFFSNRIY